VSRGVKIADVSGRIPAYSLYLYRKKLIRPYTLIDLIKLNFIHIVKKTFSLLYMGLVRPHVEYDDSIVTHIKGDMLTLRKFKKAVNLVFY